MAKINLQEQLTSELKEKWYYQQIKWGLRINRKTVVFDKEFMFKLYRHLDDGDEWFSVDIYINGKYWDLVGVYGFDRWLSDPKEILEDILLYIANRI